MNKIISSCVFIVVLCTTSVAFATEQCPAINCDCNSLPNNDWVDVCVQHETKIKKNCVDNANTPKDYCLVHGLNARPLAISISSDKTESVKEESLKELREKIDNLYWPLEVDIEKSKEAFHGKNYSRTLQILKLVDANIDQLFLKQRQVDSTLIERGNSVKRLWKGYAEKTLKYNENLHAFGEDVATLIDTAKTKKDKKIFSVLSQKIFRMSGKSYEHTGFGFGRAEKHAKAAKQWEKSADVSVTLAAINAASGGKKKAAKFSEYQAAARLHRASYYWMAAKKLANASDSLKESQKYVGRQGQEGLELLVNTAEEKTRDGILSGR